MSHDEEPIEALAKRIQREHRLRWFQTWARALVPDFELSDPMSHARLKAALCRRCGLQPSEYAQATPEDLVALIRSLCGASFDPIANEVAEVVLTERAAILYRALAALPPHEALTLPQLQALLREAGHVVEQSTITARYVPELRRLGVKNHRGKGYFLPAGARENM